MNLHKIIADDAKVAGLPDASITLIWLNKTLNATSIPPVAPGVGTQTATAQAKALMANMKKKSFGPKSTPKAWYIIHGIE